MGLGPSAAPDIMQGFSRAGEPRPAWAREVTARMATQVSVDKSLSTFLSDVARTMPGGTVTVRELVERVGERGLLMTCVFLNLPFLVPVSIPGVSTVFGLLIILIGLAVAANRMPWLPSRLMDRQLSAEQLVPTLEHGARYVARIERLLRPRLPLLTHSAAVSRFNGVMIVVAGVLLMAPFGLVPFSNTLPALAALLIALGILQRDGACVLLGYVAVAGTIVYFSVLLGAAVAAGQGLRHLVG